MNATDLIKLAGIIIGVVWLIAFLGTGISVWHAGTTNESMPGDD